MRRLSLARLAGTFTWVGLTSIGGGRAAYLYETLVERLGWLSREEFLPRLALSQLLPGPTISNLSALVGHAFRGAAGATLALLGVVLPGVIVIIALGALYFEYGVGPGLNAALRGMGAAAAGFLCVSTARMGRGVFSGRGAVWIAGLTFLGVGLLRLNTFLVVLVTAALGLWLNRPAVAARIAPRGGDRP
jgi:chromate transporter